jgi:hypothetical protein
MAESFSTPRPLKLFVGLFLVAMIALLAHQVATASAEEPYGARIKAFTAEPSSSQAGGHPDLRIYFQVSTRVDPLLPPCFCNQIKNALVETPAGFIGNPHAAAECSAAQFTLDRCPVDSQIGIASPTVGINDSGGGQLEQTPLYNLVPGVGQAGLLGFKAYMFDFPVYTVLHARTGGDYGLDAEAKGITGFFPLAAFEQTIWGVPASPIHDAERFTSGGSYPVPGPNSSNIAERPFLSNPTSCVGPLTTTLTTVANDHGVHSAQAPWPETTGCDQLGFNPSLSANPSTTDADSASGLDVALKVPQSDSPNAPSDSEIKAVTVTLPNGFSINPNAADGKTSCSDTPEDNEAAFGTEEEAKCPEYSKVGTLSLNSWALPEPIPGGIYLGKPQPGNKYRIFITADGFGTHVKLPGSVHPDPNTGQLVVTFENLPQAPLTEFNMHFFGSERGLLATPDRCGTYPVESDFVPWSNLLPEQTSTQFFQITSGPSGSPCPGQTRPFSPSFHASGESNGAGAHTSFAVEFNRPDGDQNLDTIAVKTPPGFAATLKGVPYCPDATLAEIGNPSWSGIAELASAKCPSASQVGVSSAGAGAGSRPYYAPGKVYLAGPYKGAPLSFAVVTPAVSGPYDLGNVVNRVAVNVDPVTAQVTAVSDPLPQILEGIPLRLRSVLINLNKPNFTLNPTNCKAGAVEGTVGGTEGATANRSTYYQVANCASLAFEPKLAVTLRGATKRTGNPALKAVLTQGAGESNLSRAVVTLPRSEFLEQGHIKTICTRVQFAAKQCPAASIYGRARVVSPILEHPLEGPVYLRSSSHKLPDLVAALRGPASQPIEIDLDGRISSYKKGIRASFEAIPDAPVSKFVLEMQGGKKGLLVNSTDICKGKHLVEASYAGQSGAALEAKSPIKAACGKGNKKTNKRGAK